MIRPAAFGFNHETAANNFFQNQPSESPQQLQSLALSEFDNMVATLRANEIEVIVIEDTAEPVKPDAIFPNNWISSFPDGTIAVFPMYAPSRRAEKRDDILILLKDDYRIKDIEDWSEFEAEERFLEGTGSMVIDHDNKMIYASVSERTHPAVLEKFAKAHGYQAIVFIATDIRGRPIYHTNVALTIGSAYAILCEESIEEEWELIAVRQLLESTGHELIPISRIQMNAFAGNMLEVANKTGKLFLVMSQTAYESLNNSQREKLASFAELLPIAVPTIERVEGGSVRCMMAEMFIKEKQ
jgi:hypothetical protein